MNYLLVMPRVTADVNEHYHFPLGVAYISSSLKAVRKSVYTINLNSMQGSVQGVIKAYIKKESIDVIAVGGLSPQYSDIKEIIDSAKEENPNMKAIIGGGLVSASPRLVFEGMQNADYGIIGEGEYTIRDLADVIEGKRTADSVQGIVYRNSNKEIIITEGREDIHNLDELPFPDYEGFDYAHYLTLKGNDDLLFINDYINTIIVTSRSCPYNCTFCFHTSGKKYRARSLDNVFSEIDLLVEKYKVNFLSISDELMSVNKERMLEFCHRIAPYNIKWIPQVRIDKITYEEALAMKNSGAVYLSYGFESASNTILKSMKKHLTIEGIEKGLEIAKKAGISTRAVLLFGDKEETEETFNKTLNWFIKNNQYPLSYVAIRICPGTELYDYAVNSGVINNQIKYLEDGCPIINVTKLSDEEFFNNLKTIENATQNRMYPPKKYTLKEINTVKKRLLVEINCKNCKKDFLVSADNMVNAGTARYLCPQCQQYYSVNIPMLFPKIVSNGINQYIESLKNPVILYGASARLKGFLNIIKLNNHLDITIVDSDAKKQGEKIEGFAITTPEIISEKKDCAVVICAHGTISKSAITSAITNNHKNVKELIDLNVFLKRAFFTDYTKELLKNATN